MADRLGWATSLAFDLIKPTRDRASDSGGQSNSSSGFGRCKLWFTRLRKADVGNTAPASWEHIENKLEEMGKMTGSG